MNGFELHIFKPNKYPTSVMRGSFDDLWLKGYTYGGAENCSSNNNDEVVPINE